MKNTYNVTIETTEHSIDVASFETKKKAVQYAIYLRHDGQSWGREFTKETRPSVQVYNVTKERVVYLQPFVKSIIKK